MPDQKYLSTDPNAGDTAAQVAQAIQRVRWLIDPIGSAATAAGADELPTLQTAGGVIGGAAGGIPGAMLGGASGEAVDQLQKRVRGQAAPPTMTAAASDIAHAGINQGLGMIAPEAAGAIAPYAKTVATDLWGLATGTPVRAAAEQVLSRGRGLLVPHNTDAMLQAAKAGSSPASTILDTSGQPAVAEVKSPAWAGYYAHQGAVPKIEGGSVWSLPAKALALGTSGLAQGVYSAADQAGPIGQMIRAIILSHLSSPSDKQSP